MVWVVEMETRPGVWTPTEGISLSREIGRWNLGDWRNSNPDDRFRLKSYVPRKGWRD
jgi:hypothetical protein